MALANVAVLLARMGRKVLVVDWDLEAPGIENYFNHFGKVPESYGLLSLLNEAVSRASADYRNYLTEFTIQGWPVQLLASGSGADGQYPVRLEHFSWPRFFDTGGGSLLEALREDWKEQFDFTLIDSRTGLSDTGGICTIHMPDIVVAMYTANHQSLYGVRDVMRLAQTGRQRLAVDRAQLSIVPVASRFGTDFRESRTWLDRASEAMAEFYEDWVPNWANHRDVVNQLKIPQVDYFSYGEKLAVVEQEGSDPQGMTYVYNRLATLLAHDLSEAHQVFQLRKPKVRTRKSTLRPKRPRVRATPDYQYDVYISYAHTSATEEWLRPFIDKLQQYLAEIIGRSARIFHDYTVVVESGCQWTKPVADALLRSKVLLAVLTPEYTESPWALAEWKTFEKRERQVTHLAPLIFPLVLGDAIDGAPAKMQERLDVTTTTVFFSDQHILSNDQEIIRLAELLGESLERAPEFQKFALVEPDDVADFLNEPPPNMTVRTGSILLEPITYESLSRYTKIKFPAKAVSERLQVLLLRDLGRGRFKTIGEIDQAVYRAGPAVTVYANENPQWFQFGTDYITKSLGFTDEQFRARHGFASLTREAFKKYQHLVRPGLGSMPAQRGQAQS